MKILFVCLGNTCRSPMAEALYKKTSKLFGRDDFVASCGISAKEGEKANNKAVVIMAGKDIDITSHNSHQITEKDINAFDLVLCMDNDIADWIIAKYPPANCNKIYYFGAFVGRSSSEVNDPFNGTLDEYRARAELLDVLTTALARTLNDTCS